MGNNLYIILNLVVNKRYEDNNLCVIMNLLTNRYS